MHYTPFVTVLALLMYLGTMFMVGRARGKHGIKAPAISGNPDFERAFRVQQTHKAKCNHFPDNVLLSGFLQLRKGLVVP